MHEKAHEGFWPSLHPGSCAAVSQVVILYDNHRRIWCSVYTQKKNAWVMHRPGLLCFDLTYDVGSSQSRRMFSCTRCIYYEIRLCGIILRLSFLQLQVFILDSNQNQSHPQQHNIYSLFCIRLMWTDLQKGREHDGQSCNPAQRGTHPYRFIFIHNLWVNSSSQHVFGLKEKTRTLGGNPYRHREDMQAAHR